MSNREVDNHLNEIAIVGLAGRFPRARNIEEFWLRLCKGEECISFFSQEELQGAGVSEGKILHPSYVKAGAILEDIEQFDAEFFQYTPKMAELLNPQYRLFLELAWQALEHAGYDPETYEGSIGVYAGASANQYLSRIYAQSSFMESTDPFQVATVNDKDYIAPITSYKLNLRGPSISIQTACSTSLVAVHMACQSLLNGECDIALAGGVSIRYLQKTGYLYQEGGILSPDGHCRAFDAQAEGTVGGDGVGIVVLQRLTDALTERATIHAIIKGSAVNNDGSLKVGYTAPSVDGQANVLLEAQTVSDVDPETITYIEAHGTGTALGDPIEIAALTQAFRHGTQKKNFCAIGSVKTNVGHLDAAAGSAGLIKTVLALKHKMLPPSLHFTQANPEIDFANSPFYVNNRLTEWKANQFPRRAGVSSFGIGGTNAHVILEEAPPVQASKYSRPAHLLILSSKTHSSLETMTANLATYLQLHPDLSLGDVAYTLQRGRRAFDHRRTVVCSTLEEARTALQARENGKFSLTPQIQKDRPIIFLFPGQGTQYIDMARQLYQIEPIFREQVDICAELLQPYLKLDLRHILYPSERRIDEAKQQIEQTLLAQPALFVIEYALAKLWMEWGVLPHAMIGHSLGEYVAACLAGVFSLEDAIAVIATRGEIMQRLPTGSMLAVSLSEEEVLPLLNSTLSLAAINAPSRCVVSGPLDAVAELESLLSQRGVTCRTLQTSHAFHSSMQEDIIEPFTEQMKKIHLNAPQIPYISNLTATWITATETTNPAYWAAQLRQTVHFADGLLELMKETHGIFLEVGPGTTLNTLVRQYPGKNAQQLVLPSLHSSRQSTGDVEFLLHTVGQMWTAGVDINWSRFQAAEQGCRIPLPPYPFERKRYWVESPPAGAGPVRPPDASLPPMPGQRVMSRPGPTPTENARKEEPMQIREVVGTGLAHSATLTRQERIISQLKSVSERSFGIAPENIDIHVSFFEMGADSLALLQVSQAIQDIFHIKIRFRLLIDQYSTIGALAEYIEKELPPEIYETTPVTVPQEVTPITLSSEPYLSPPLGSPATDSSQNPSEQGAEERDVPLLPTPPSSHSLEGIMGQQLQIMAQQLDLLRATYSTNTKKLPFSQAEHEEPLTIRNNPLQASLDAPGLSEAKSANLDGLPQKREETNITVSLPSPGKGHKLTLSQQIDPESFVPYQPPAQRRAAQSFSSSEQEYLNSTIERISRRTRESKRMAQFYRPFLADSRATFGFTLPFKELTYPIIVQRASGARMWDVDGNEYLDLAMGFGSLLFGHSPSFITEALEKQIKSGIQLGLQSNLVGKVAQLLCEMTGVERVAFCNSGTEAVMSALRLARAATGRTRIALFAGSFHGTFDGVMIRTREVENGKLQAAPLAPGVPPSIIGDAIALRFDAPESLDILKTHLHELAAVLVEPPQSRRPDLQPVAFIRELRRLTQEAGVALIFDEVVTGFRTHPGGAQALMGIQADLVTYGKALGGGVPIGVVAGKASYMDFIDGGTWNYGDASYPQVEQTFFAGTYFKHPLTMAVIWAVLHHLQTSGQELQQRLNHLTQGLVEALNAFFEDKQLPMRTVHYGSLFRFIFPPSLKRIEANLFFYHLLERGIYCGEGRNCFLSTAHTEDDVQQIIQATQESITAMQAGGFLLPPASQRETAKGPFFSPPLQSQAHPLSSLKSELPRAGMQEQGKPESFTNLLPLTDAQRELWILSQMEDDASRSYNEPLLLHMQGPLDLKAIKKAFQQLVDRHEALRTTFSPAGEYQQIAPVLKGEIALLDFSPTDATRRKSQLSAWLTEELRKPFDLEHGPLWRTYVVKLDDQDHLLLMIYHHLIADGTSAGILLQELKVIYSAECQGLAFQLPEPTQYREYIQWYRSLDMPQVNTYWLKQFEDVVPPLELPTDFPRPAVKTYSGSHCSLTLDASLSKQLQTVSSRLKCTLFSVLLAGFATLLHRLTGQDDIVIGTATAGQAWMGSRHLVGYCIHLLPLRSRVSGDPSFSGYLYALEQTFLDACDHQPFSLTQLEKKLKLGRDPSRLPLINSAFNLDRSENLHFATVEVEILAPPTAFSKFDLDMNVTKKNSELLVDCTYNTELFEEQTILRWMKHFRTLLEAIVSNSERRLSELPLLAEQEKQQVLVDWNSTRIASSHVSCLYDLFHKQVERSPDAIAVTFEEWQLTYLELDQRTNQLSHYLCSLGIGPGSLVGLCIERSLEMLIGLLSILKAGGAYVPLDPDYPQERLAFILQDTQVPVVLTQEHWRTFLPAYAGQVVCLDKSWNELKVEKAENFVQKISADNLAYVMYTSGSTGQPKGVMVSHRAIVNRLFWAQNASPLTPDDRILQTASFSFDISIWELVGPLLTGARVVLLRPNGLLDSNYLIRQLIEEQITVFHAVPSLLQVLVERPEIEQCTHLRWIYTGGEIVPATLLSHLLARLRTEVFLFYGPTEASINATAWYCSPNDQVQRVFLGRPIANVQVYLLDTHLQPVPIGVLGEIYIGGVGLAQGYLRRPDLTAERFIPNPFGRNDAESPYDDRRLYKTGDLARYRPDGLLEFRGRNDAQVKIKGYRIELGEIEAALAQHPAVREGVVLAREESRGGKHLAASVVLVPGWTRSPDDLRSYLQQKLPGHMIPTTFQFLDAFPLTPNGKIDRQSIASSYGVDSESQRSTVFVAPRFPLEQSLADIWSEMLNVKSIGVHDNFFELGGDSILALRIIAKANESSIQLTVKQIFTYQTIAALTEVVNASPLRASEEEVVTGSVPLTPVQYYFFEQQLSHPNHYNQSLLLKTQRSIDPLLLEQAIRHLLLHHDALRLRFSRYQMEWRQLIAGPGEPVPLLQVDLSAQPLESQKQAIEAKAAELQATLHLEDGPLIRVALFYLGEHEPQRLLIIIHHLAIDIVSWRILLNDLQSAYTQLEEGQPVQLPPKTSSFLWWTKCLHEYAQSPEVQEDLRSWLREPRSQVRPLPATYPAGANTVISERTVSLSLSSELTQDLLHRVPQAYHVQVLDVLLTALALALVNWTGKRLVLIDLEGHGREQIRDTINLSRTVGWFTSLTPVLFNLEKVAHPVEALQLIKEELRSMPNGGIHYGLLRYLSKDKTVGERLKRLPQAEVVFNYMGRSSQMVSEESLFSPAEESAGPGRSPLGKRGYLLDIEARIRGEHLEIHCTYSEQVHHPSEIEKFAQEMLGSVQALIKACSTPETGEIDPSDFPQANLDKHRLSELLSQVRFGNNE